jgi:two-component system OmpR family response regulator
MSNPPVQDRSKPLVLIIEDDENLAYLIMEALGNKGFEVAARTGPGAGLDLHRERKADLIILDRMFPEADGLAVLRTLRVAGDEVPVIMLTSMSELADRVEGLGQGADDYLGKPFSILELQARVQALLRRARGQGPGRAETTAAGPFRLDWEQMRVVREGRDQDITPQEFRILALLLRAAGKPLSRDELLAHAWPAIGRPASPRTVDVYIARLRSKLTRAQDPAWILTREGQGYCWKG